VFYQSFILILLFQQQESFLATRLFRSHNLLLILKNCHFLLQLRANANLNHVNLKPSQENCNRYFSCPCWHNPSSMRNKLCFYKLKSCRKNHKNLFQSRHPGSIFMQEVSGGIKDVPDKITVEDNVH